MATLGSRKRTAVALPDLNTRGKGTLKNFTIPRKRRATGTCSTFLEPCSKESREFSFILSTLNDSRLDPNKYIFLSSDCQQVKLIHNEQLLKEFSEKRSEMRSKGRNLREMEEKFCFLVESAAATDHLCEQGLRVDKKAQHTLGNPVHGVCLYRHVDVALKNSTNRNIIIFKVIFGKVKRVPINLGKNAMMDPVIHSDCYISKDPAGPKDSLLQQASSSSVYFFDYDENQELNTRPRQCLPYAVVIVASNGNAFSAVSSSNLVLPMKMPSVEMSSGSSKSLKTCTVAERWGRGQNATVTFRQFGGLENVMHDLGYNSPKFEIASPFQRVEQMNTHQTRLPTMLQNGRDLHLQQTFDYYALQQQWTPKAQLEGHFSASAPFTEGNILPGGPTSNTINSILDISGSSIDTHNSMYVSRNTKLPSSDLSIAVAVSNVSTTVFNSRVVRDPRLFRQESSNFSQTSAVGIQQDMPTGQIRHNSGLEINCSNFAQAWALKTPEYGYLKTGQQQVMHTLLPGTDFIDQTNNSFKSNSGPEQSALLAVLSKHPGNTSEDIECNSVNDRESSSSSLDIKEMDEHRKKNEEKIPEKSAHEAVAVAIEHGSVVSNAGSQTLIDKLFSQDDHKQYIDKQNTDLQFIQLMSYSGKEDAQIHDIHEKSSDLKISHLKTGKDSLSKEVTSFLRSGKVSKNAECIEVYEKNSTPVSEETQIPMDCPCLDHPETCESINNFWQNSETKIIFESVRGGDSQEINAREKNVGQSEEFMSAGSFQEVHHIDDLKEVHIIKSDVIPNAVSVHGKEVNPSSKHLKPEGLASKASNCIVANNDVTTSIQHAICGNEEKQLSDPLLCVLYKRIQFNQLFLTASPVEQLSDKSYLKPRNLENHLGNICLSPLESIKQTNKKYKLRVTIKADNMSTGFLEQHILSDKIPFTKSRKKKEDPSIVLEDKSVNSSPVSEVINNGKDSQNIENLELVSRDTSNYVVEAHTTEGHNARLVKKLAEKYRKKSELSFIKQHDKTKNKTATKPISEILQSDRSDSLESSLKDSSYPAQLPQEDIVFSSFRPASTVSTLNTSCFIKKQEEYNFANDLGSTEKHDSVSVVHPTIQDKSMMDCTTIKLCECRASRTCNLKKAVTLKKMRGDRKQAGKATQHQRRKPKGKRLLYRANNVHLMPAWKNKKVLSNSFMLFKCLQMEQRKCLGRSRKIKRNNTRKGSVKQKGKKSNVWNNLGTFTTAEKNGEVTEDNNSEMKMALVNLLPKQAANSPPECISLSTSADLKAQNSEAQSFETDKAEKSDKIYNPKLFKSAGKTEHDINVKCQDEHTSQCISLPVFSSGDTSVALPKERKKDNILHELTEKLPEESQITMHLSKTSEETLSNNVTALSKGTLWLSEPQPKLPMSLEADPVKATIRMEKDKNSHMQEHIVNNMSSKIRLITKLRHYLQKTDASKNVLQSNNSEVVGNSTKPPNLETAEKIIRDLTTQQPEFEICAGMKLPYCRPEDTTFTSNTKKETAFLDSSNLTPVEDIITPCKSEGKLFSKKTTIRENNKNILTGNKQHEQTPVVLEEEQNQSTIGPCDVVVSGSVGNDNQHYTLKLNEKNQQIVHSEHNTNNLVGVGVKKPDVSTNQRKNEPAFNTTSFQKKHNATDISDTLREADRLASKEELTSLRDRCKEMLQFFISTFENDQNIGFDEVIISKDLILDKYLDHPPKAVDLKYEALHSFFELQMMMEAMQFIENKIRFLSGEPTFRSLLWYDQTLNSELYKGRVKYHLQSSTYASDQENISSKGNRTFQQYTSVLNHQHARFTETSYYMYLKSRREKLEVEAAMKNNLHSGSFNLSIPLTCNVNFGDKLESLEVLQKHVSTFTDTYFAHLQRNCDAGIPEHLSILCRFLDEKIKYLKTCKATDSQVAWFGLEQVCYNASKILVWKSSKEAHAFKSLAVLKDAMQKLIGGLTETEISSSKLKIQKDTASPKRSKSHQFMMGNKKRRQIKHCENVILTRDFSQNKGWHGNPLVRQNEVVNRPTKCKNNLGNQLLPVPSGDNGNAQHETWNWGSFEAELDNIHSASAQFIFCGFIFCN
ncbi:uncharacterized protein tex15 [Scleropages formosus]|uniref:Testis-expressed sequence 15 protein-like n=1 Tax=Scleropages formosus TaxID=113540 RepID=A0A8C9R9E0_SCLFO|nr:testis-expressed protein 15 [Scleropages formosus]